MERSTPSSRSTFPAVAGRRERTAVTAVFAGNGLLFASLYARLPEVQERLRLDEGELGLALLGGPIGLAVAVPLVGAAVVRRGSRLAAGVAAAAYAFVLALPAVVPGAGWLFAAFVLLGIANGALDVAMNTQGVTVERRHPRRLFASLHAAFSLGALVGALSAGALAAAGVPLLAHLVGAGVLGAALFASAIAAFLPDDDDARTGPAFARPTRPLAAIGVVGLCALLAEGAVSDWSAVYLDEVQGAGPGTAATGLAVFSLAMGAGRLAADPLTERTGSRRLCRVGLALAALSLAAAAVAPSPATTLTAFVALGLGLAAVYPLCLRAAAATPGVPAGAGIAAVTATGYAGLLAGPPLVGLLADATSLRGSLAALAGLCVVAAVLARAIRDDPAPTTVDAIRTETVEHPPPSTPDGETGAQPAGSAFR